jgi:transposase-like protein
LPGRRRTKEEKALAIAATAAGSVDEAGALIQAAPSTIRRWVKELETLDDSDLEALIVSKKRVMSGLWGILGVDALEFAQELRAAGNPKGFQAAMTAAGICGTKLDALGQPRNITTQATSGPVFTTPFNPTSAPSEQRTAENSKEPQGSE